MKEQGREGSRPRPGGLRARHPLTPAQEHAYLVAGSKLFNRRLFFETHEEWEEVWRRSAGDRRELLRGLIQIAVGYEHLKRGNHYGAKSLLSQGIRKIRPHARFAGVWKMVHRVEEDLSRITADPGLTVTRLRPPKVMLRLRGFEAKAAPDAIKIHIARSLY